MFNFIKNFFLKKEKSNLTWKDKLSNALTKSANQLSLSLKSSFKNKIDAEFLNKLKEVLLKSDVGVTTSNELIEKIRDNKSNQEISFDELQNLLVKEITNLLEESVEELEIKFEGKKPHVIMVCGVNGSGKTTSIGKIANHYHGQGKRILLGACDSFRAAAGNQLDIWAKRIGCDIVLPEKEGADAASIAYKTLKKATDENYDLVIIDTAGRLQNHKNLMAELSKIVRVMQKIDDTAPHNSLLVLDATVGQNAKKQVEMFKKEVGIDGLVVTKLDGSAKGGIIISLTREFDVKLYFIGVGEGINDLKPFNALDFSQALFTSTIS